MNLLDEYQEFTKTTAIYPGHDIINSIKAYDYLGLALGGESGEICEKLKKILRDKGGQLLEEDRVALTKELGDCTYYISQLCNTCELNLQNLLSNSVQDFSYLQRKGLNQLAHHLKYYIGVITNFIDEAIQLDADPGEFGELHSETIVAIYTILDSIADRLDVTLEEVIKGNIEKLTSRKERGVISGSGDNR